MNSAMQAAIATHLNISPNQIREVQEWASVLFVRFTVGRPKFVSKKVAVMSSNFVKVETYMERVVLDLDNQVGYVVRPGYDMGNFYLIKRFNPVGVDVRGLDFSTVDGERLADKPTDKENSAEYKAVMAAMVSTQSLVGYGAPGDVRFPEGYEVCNEF